MTLLGKGCISLLFGQPKLWLSQDVNSQELPAQILSNSLPGSAIKPSTEIPGTHFTLTFRDFNVFKQLCRFSVVSG
jgi:hypothetical protein